MNAPSTSATPVSRVSPIDADLAEQAKPGYGVPSQDPRPEAQQTLLPDEADREARSVYVGGAVMAGAAAGASLGVAVAGPVGAFVGGTIGGIAGALGGAAAGAGAEVPVGEEPPADLAHRRV